MKADRGNVHDRRVVDIRPVSFEPETEYVDDENNAAKNAADLETLSCFESACHMREKDIPHTRNNWVCYEFKERRIVPTHCAIHWNNYKPGGDKCWSRRIGGLHRRTK
jgi:hypothetical protein